MPRFAFANGSFVPHEHAVTHIEDRGFQLADGIYEMVAIMNGKFVDFTGHMDRLARSLHELHIAWPMERRILELKMAQLVRLNRLKNGKIYVQITRGTAPRDFQFPQNTRPNLFMTTGRISNFRTKTKLEGIRVITVPDIRWKRRDIKTTGLLAQVLAKQKAVEAGVEDAWFMDEDGFITEGYANNAWIITKDQVLVTRQTDHDILSGVTRSSILELSRSLNVKVEIRPFDLAELLEAKEAFSSSATTFVTPVIEVNHHKIGDGKVGSISKALQDAYFEYAEGENDDIQWHA